MIIIFGVWLLMSITGIFSVGFRKTLSINRWFFVVFFVGVFGLFTQWLFFFPAWFLRNKRLNPFWYWLDDTRFSYLRVSGYSEDYEIHLGGKKETILTAYKWHMRNRVWNLNTLFKPKQQNITIGNQSIKVVDIVYDSLVNGLGQKIKVGGFYEAFAGLKYYKDGVSTWNTNNGQEINKEKSRLGKRIIWYEVDGWLGFQYSYCVYVDYHFWEGWRTVKLGTNTKGYVFVIKHQKNKEWK